MMSCQHCSGQLLRQRELGEAPSFKCLQCSRVVYPQAAELIGGNGPNGEAAKAPNRVYRGSYPKELRIASSAA